MNPTRTQSDRLMMKRLWLLVRGASRRLAERIYFVRAKFGSY
jgi:hypothetical protein